MKSTGFLIFFLVFFSIYISLHLYLWRWGLRYIANPLVRRLWGFSLLACGLVYPLARIYTRLISHSSSFLAPAGSLWLALFLYMLLIAVALNPVLIIIRLLHGDSLLDRLRNKIPPFVIICSIFIVTLGYHVASSPVVRTIDIDFRIHGEVKSPLKIVLATDIHLGTIIRNSRLLSLINLINAQEPDLVILGGDIIDEGCESVIALRMHEDLGKIRSRLGTYAVTGNHEFIGGDTDSTVRCLTDSGVNFLRDTGMEISGIFLAGREDRASERFAGYTRQPVKKIISGNRSGLPVILVDHQPFDIREARDAGVKLLLCGHTHNGQLWPFNYLLRFFFDHYIGYMKTGDMHVYVSSGCGTWGPPVRTTGKPEIVVININFRN